MLTNELELRILSSIHKGARVRLTDRLSVGGTLEHDVFLRSPGVAGAGWLLQLSVHGWSWTDNASGVTTDAGFGEIVRIGDVAVTVDRDDADWPDENAILSAPAVAATGNPAEPASPVETPPAALVVEQIPERHDDATPPEPADALPASSLARKRSTATSVMLIGGGLVFGFLLVAAWLFLRPPSLPMAPLKAQPKALDESTLSAYRTVLAELDLEKAVRVHGDEDGVRLIGVVDNSNILDTLAMRLASFDPRPALSITTAEEMQAAATAAIQHISSRLQVTCRQANCTLMGVARTSEDIEKARAVLVDEFPAMAVVAEDVLLPDDVAKRFVAQLGKMGLHGFKSSWDGTELAIVGTLRDSQYAELMSALATLADQTRDVIAFRLTIDDRQTTPEQVAVSAKMPFGIVAVVGGSFPYVTTSTGENVLLGSSFMGYRLSRIEPAQVVFDGPRMLTFKR